MRVPVPTSRLALVTVFAAVAVAVVPGSVAIRLLVVNGAIASAVLADLVLAIPDSRVRIGRSIPPVIALGARAEVSWSLRTDAGRRVDIAIADDLAPGLGARRRAVRVRVPARGTVSVAAELTPQRRGRYVLGGIALRWSGPLGLVARQRFRELPAEVRVHPAFPSRREAELRIDRARILEVGTRSARGRGGGTDFESLRDYSVDDQFRHIDWSATARAGRPIVREYRSERNQRVVILLDTGRVMAGTVGEVPRLELAMDAALLVTTVATRLGDRCGLIAHDRDERCWVPLSRTAGQTARVAGALFDLEAALVETDHRAAIVDTLARFPRRAMLVVLTDLVEQAVDEGLLPALPMVSRTHLVVVAAVRDPAVVAWSRGRAAVGDEHPPDPYRQAAAVRTLRIRERAAARLREVGAVVVDEEPAALAGALGDVYLEVKATGRL